MDSRYDDIIHLPHHQSSTRARMPRRSRAAQFAPFAALTGYDDAVTETARLTEARRILDEDEIAVIDRKLQFLFSLDARPAVCITYFRPDRKKAGGSYITAAGTPVSYQELRHEIRLDDGTSIPVDDIIAIEGDLLWNSGDEPGS